MHSVFAFVDHHAFGARVGGGSGGSSGGSAYQHYQSRDVTLSLVLRYIDAASTSPTHSGAEIVRAERSLCALLAAAAMRLGKKVSCVLSYCFLRCIVVQLLLVYYILFGLFRIIVICMWFQLVLHQHWIHESLRLHCAVRIGFLYCRRPL